MSDFWGLLQFALKPGDTKTRNYSHKGNNIEIKSGPFGIATQFDKNLLIYCLSQLMTVINHGETPGRTVRIKAYDLLQYLNRDSGGKGYTELKSSFDRLDGTRLKTNIKSGGHSITSWFGLVESIDVSYHPDDKKRMSYIDITVSQWLYNSAISKEVLIMNDRYFGIRSPLKRRLYEIARKHCGKTKEWHIAPDILYLKSGSSCSRKEFNRSLRHIAIKDDMPDYSMLCIGNQSSSKFKKCTRVVFKPKKTASTEKS